MENIKVENQRLVEKLNEQLGRNSGDTFTVDELLKVTTLSFKNIALSDEDLLVLGYCTNLQTLLIKSQHPKAVKEKDIENESEWRSKKVTAKDFSFLKKLHNLTVLKIENVDNVESVDLSENPHLETLSLEGNSNLRSVKGFQSLSNLRALSLWSNPLLDSFDGLLELINTMAKNHEGKYLYLDVDLYPLLRKEMPNIDEFLDECGVSLTWIEKLNECERNELTTSQVSEMYDKVQKELSIDPNDEEYIKTAKIYRYIINATAYDHELLEISEKILKHHGGIITFPDGTCLRTKLIHSSYYAITRGTSICEGYSNAMHFVLKGYGIDSKTIGCRSGDQATGKYVGSNSNHSIIKVRIANNWYYFDPTNDNKENPHICFRNKDGFRKGFNLSLSEIDEPSADVSKLDELVERPIREKIQNNKYCIVLEDAKDPYEVDGVSYSLDIDMRSRHLSLEQLRSDIQSIAIFEHQRHSSNSTKLIETLLDKTYYTRAEKQDDGEFKRDEATQGAYDTIIASVLQEAIDSNNIDAAIDTLNKKRREIVLQNKEKALVFFESAAAEGQYRLAKRKNVQDLGRETLNEQQDTAFKNIVEHEISKQELINRDSKEEIDPASL